MDTVNTFYLDTAQLRRAFEAHVADIESALISREEQIAAHTLRVSELARQVSRLTGSLLRLRRENIRLRSLIVRKPKPKSKKRRAVRRR